MSSWRLWCSGWWFFMQPLTLPSFTIELLCSLPVKSIWLIKVGTLFLQRHPLHNWTELAVKLELPLFSRSTEKLLPSVKIFYIANWFHSVPSSNCWKQWQRYDLQTLKFVYAQSMVVYGQKPIRKILCPRGPVNGHDTESLSGSQHAKCPCLGQTPKH